MPTTMTMCVSGPDQFLKQAARNARLYLLRHPPPFAFLPLLNVTTIYIRILTRWPGHSWPIYDKNWLSEIIGGKDIFHRRIFVKRNNRTNIRVLASWNFANLWIVNCKIEIVWQWIFKLEYIKCVYKTTLSGPQGWYIFSTRHSLCVASVTFHGIKTAMLF